MSLVRSVIEIEVGGEVGGTLTTPRREVYLNAWCVQFECTHAHGDKAV